MSKLALTHSHKLLSSLALPIFLSNISHTYASLRQPIQLGSKAPPFPFNEEALAIKCGFMLLSHRAFLSVPFAGLNDSLSRIIDLWLSTHGNTSAAWKIKVCSSVAAKNWIQVRVALESSHLSSYIKIRGEKKILERINW